MTVSKEQLAKPRLEEAEVEIPGVGTVRVRALSRGEIFRMQKVATKDTGARERLILSLGMLEPAMTEIDVQNWQEAAPAGELDGPVDKIRKLSGLEEKAEKEAVLDFRDGPDDGVRALPSSEAGDDGGHDSGDE